MMHAANRTKSCRLRTACCIDGSDLKCWAGAPNMPASHVAASWSNRRQRRAGRRRVKRQVNLTSSSTSATESSSDCEEPPSSSASSRSPCMSGLFALSIAPLAALPLPRPLLGPCRSPPALWLLDWLATIFSS